MNQANLHKEPTAKVETKATRFTTRGKVALFLSGTIAGSLIHPVYDGVSGLFDKAKDNIHQANESGKYSQRNLYETMHENGGFDSSKDFIYTVGPADYPELIATNVGAKDIRLVASEISGQEGGADNLHIGDEVVLPKDQLVMPDDGGNK